MSPQIRRQINSSNMADNVSKVGGTSNTNKDDTKSAVYDSALDFYSDKFDPLKALYTPHLKPPVVDARLYDNLSLYESARKQTSADADGGKTKSQQKSKQSKQSDETPFERNWLPHQLPVPGTRKKRRDVLLRMETISGPLSMLKKCIDQKLMVKVWTRNATGIRGYCSGYVSVFDKHWNICLENVTEVWTRKTRRKAPPINVNQRHPRGKSKNTIKLPEVTIIKSEKKTETCQRSMPQIMIRGEQVALISIENVR